MSNDLFNCIENARSVRSFKNEMVPLELLEKVLYAATMAPSAGNLQPWFFYVVTDKNIKQKLEDASNQQEQIAAAPCVIAVMADTGKANTKYQERGAQLYCIQDTAAAIQNMLLAAEALKLDTCWVGAFDEIAVQTILEVPEHFRAVAMICIGYSDEVKDHNKKRLSVKEVTKYLS